MHSQTIMLPTTRETGVASMHAVWTELRHLEAWYPGFRRWYWRKVVPGVGNGTRCIFTAQVNGALAGVAIAKSAEEKKLCTVWTAPEYRRQSLARGLMEASMEWLQTERPLFTVPNERLAGFDRLVDRFGFNLTHVAEDFYGLGRVEHVFNGSLVHPTHA